MKIREFVFFGLLSFFIAACGAERANDPVEATADTLSGAIEQAIDYSVINAVDGFTVKANNFNLSADSFCQSVDEPNLAALQQAWVALFIQWYRLANYNFGPLNNDLVFPIYTFIDSLRLRGTDYLGTVRTEIATDMASSDLLTDAYFAGKTFQRVGLLALESAAFETISGDNSSAAADIVSEYESNPRKCVVLKGLANQILVHATNVQNGWKVNLDGSEKSYRDIFLAAEIEDGTEPLTLLITSVQGYLDYLQQRNVVTTAAKLSGVAWDAIAASIDEVESLLEGTDETTYSFLGIMESSGAQVGVDSVRANIAEVRESISRKDADMLEIALGKLDGNFKREIPNGLDVELGINFSDGD